MAALPPDAGLPAVPAAAPPDPSAEPTEPAVRTRRLALASVLAVPFIANLVAIVGIEQYQPQAKSSGIGLVHQVGILSGGQAFVDPNVGFNQYPFGHAVALAWLHGHVPWWDFNQGLGTPLAGSMQSGAFFPPTLLMALGTGSLWFHLCLELLAGWACYALLRELRCSPFAGAVGAIAFELNGSLAWLTNAPANPVPFLPVMLLGIEWCVKAAGAKRHGGWVMLAVGVWLTIVSGFPEVAALNVGLAVIWFVVRLVQYRGDALRIAGRAAVGGVVGVFVAAPELNAFVRNFRLDMVGVHTLDLANLSIPRTGLAMLVAPYVFGGLHDSQAAQVFGIWGRVGGYSGVTLLALGTSGLFGRRLRAMRVVLGAWAFVFLGYIYDVPVLHQFVDHLPGLAHIAVYRYVTSSVLFCLCVLAGLFIDDLRRAEPFAAFLRMLPGIAIVLVAFTVGFLSTTSGRQWSLKNLPKWYWGSISIFAVLVLVLIVAMLALLSPRRHQLVKVCLGAMLVVEAFGFFEVPILSFPRNVTYDTSVVSYLQDHVGTQRYYTIGPVSPDFGAFYGIHSLDLTDLPVPKNWTNFVHAHLNPCIAPWQFGNGAPMPNCATPAQEEIAYATYYEQSAVKYFVIGYKNKLEGLFQPNLHGGATTPDGAATTILRLRPPSFFPDARITGFDLEVVGSAPPGLATTACSAGSCVDATPDGPGSVGTHFALSRPLTLSGEVRITLGASNEFPIVIRTQPSVPFVPSSVTTDGTVLADRSSMLQFDYVASSVPRQVFASKYSRVYLLPHASPLATAPNCSVAAHSVTSFTTRCRTASTLTYRELSFPGWKATVAGSSAKITTASNGVYQEVALPAGTATVTFSYEPPGSLIAWIAMFLGIAAILFEGLRRSLDRDGGRTTWRWGAGTPTVAAGSPAPTTGGPAPDPGRLEPRAAPGVEQT